MIVRTFRDDCVKPDSAKQVQTPFAGGARECAIRGLARLSVTMIALGALVAWSRPGAAQSSTESSPMLVSGPPSVRSVRTHKGVAVSAVFVRAALGAGYFQNSTKSDPINNPNFVNPIEVQATIKAGGAAGQLEAGYSLRPGLAVGLGVYLQQIAWTRAWGATLGDAVTKQTLYEFDYRFKARMMTLVGPFVDFYPFPTLGWHLDAGVGLAIISIGRGTDAGTHKVAGPALNDLGGAGVAFQFGTGYEFWLADGLSMGFLLRFIVGTGSAKADDGIGWQNTALSPAALVSFTMD